MSIDIRRHSQRADPHRQPVRARHREQAACGRERDGQNVTGSTCWWKTCPASVGTFGIASAVVTLPAVGLRRDLDGLAPTLAGAAVQLTMLPCHRACGGRRHRV
ncbi:MAG: hypothetical protein ACK501_16615 [Planctomycetota bacterium]